jgi:hypothetical protein
MNRPSTQPGSGCVSTATGCGGGATARGAARRGTGRNRTSAAPPRDLGATRGAGTCNVLARVGGASARAPGRTGSGAARATPASGEPPVRLEASSADSTPHATSAATRARPARGTEVASALLSRCGRRGTAIGAGATVPWACDTSSYEMSGRPRCHRTSPIARTSPLAAIRVASPAASSLACPNDSPTNRPVARSMPGSGPSGRATSDARGAMKRPASRSRAAGRGVRCTRRGYGRPACPDPRGACRKCVSERAGTRAA